TNAIQITDETLGLNSTIRNGEYDEDYYFVLSDSAAVPSPTSETEMLDSRETRRTDRALSAAQLASPLAGPLRRFLYPHTEQIGSGAAADTSETLNILGVDIKLTVKGSGDADAPPSGRIGQLSDVRTFDMSQGLGVPQQADGESASDFEDRLDEWSERKSFLARTAVDDVIGRHYTTYRYTGSDLSTLSFDNVDFGTDPRFEAITVNFNTTRDTTAQTVTHGNVVLVEYDTVSYGLYEFVAGSAGHSENFTFAAEDFTDTNRWNPMTITHESHVDVPRQLGPDFDASAYLTSTSVAYGQTVVVTVDSNLKIYRFVGVDAGSSEDVTFGTEDFTDTERWEFVVDGATIPLSLETGQLVSDTNDLQRVTIQIVDDVNIETLDSDSHNGEDDGTLSVTADGDVALNGASDLFIQQIVSTGNVRVRSIGDLVDLETADGAAVIAAGDVNLNGKIIRGVNIVDGVNSPLRVLVPFSAELSGSSDADFRVIQGNGTYAVNGSNIPYGDLTVSRAYARGNMDITVTDGDLTIGKLEALGIVTLTTNQNLLDGSPSSTPTDWNVYAPQLVLNVDGNVGLLT
ncbi:hypothetical protein, partial [Rhodopirellula sallentina]